MNYEQIKAWYDNRKGGWRPLRAYKYFLDLILDNDSKVNGRLLLDLGCGHGQLLALAEERGLSTVGYDISPVSVTKAKLASPRSIILERNFATTPPVCKYDYICCIGALEHTLDIARSVQNICAYGKRNTRYLIVVPNKKFFLAGTDQQEINETLHTFEEWQSILSLNGLTVIEVVKDLSLADKYTGVKKFIISTILEIVPLKFTYQFCFVCKNKYI